MDFSKSNYGTTEAVEKSVTVQLRDPFDTDDLIFSPLYDSKGDVVIVDGRPSKDESKPVTFGVKHVRCEAGKQVAKRFDKMAAKGVKIDPEKFSIAILSAITTGWTNMDDDEGAIDCTPEKVTQFLTQYVDFIPQLSAVASNLQNYGVDADLFTGQPKP